MRSFRPYDKIDKIDNEIPVDVVPRGARKEIFMPYDSSQYPIPNTDEVVNALRDVFTESLQALLPLKTIVTLSIFLLGLFTLRAELWCSARDALAVFVV